MKRNLFFSFCFIFLFAFFSFSTIIFSQSDFEGKVVMSVSSGGDDEASEINYFVKNGKVRFEVNEKQQANMIMDPKAKKMYVIMPSQNMYMEMDMDAMKGMAEKYKENIKGEKKENKLDGDFNMTGETKTINSYKCEKWLYDDDGDKTEAWMTKELGNFMGFQNPMMGNSGPSWQDKITGQGYFPMLVKHYDDDGKVDGTMEVKSVEKKSLDDSMFEVPASYKKFEMPMMNK